MCVCLTALAFVFGGGGEGLTSEGHEQEKKEEEWVEKTNNRPVNNIPSFLCAPPIPPIPLMAKQRSIGRARSLGAAKNAGCCVWWTGGGPSCKKKERQGCQVGWATAIFLAMGAYA